MDQWVYNVKENIFPSKPPDCIQQQVQAIKYAKSEGSTDSVGYSSDGNRGTWWFAKLDFI